MYMAVIALVMSLFLSNRVNAADPTAHRLAEPALMLVQARVQTVEADLSDGSTHATLEIIKVYAGPATANGKTFQDISKVQDLRGTSAWPELKADEEGIWTLRDTADGLLPTSDPRVPFRTRSRARDNPRHSQMIALAEAVAEYGHAKLDNRLAVLQSLALDKAPEVSAWAVRTIPSTASDRATGKILDSLLVESRLPRLGQIALDELLCERQGKAWQTAEPRLKRLRSWMSDKVDEFDATASIRRVDLAAQKGELDDVTATELAMTAAQNDMFTVGVRREAIYLIGRIAQRTKNYAGSLNFLTGQVEKSEEKDLRWAAALTIRNFIPLDAESAKTAQGLIDRTADPRVVAALTEAIAKVRR